MVREIAAAGSVSVPPGARVLDLTGRLVIPGLAGVHDHLFYPTASGQASPPPAEFGQSKYCVGHSSA